MQHISDILYDDEKILKEMTFTKIPIIILWAVTALITIILIAVSAATVIDDIGWLIVVLVIFILFVVCGIYTATYLSRTFVVTNKRIIYFCGFLTHRYLDIPLNKIQVVRCIQTIWQRIFKYGTIVISNSVYGIIGHRWNGVTNFKSIKTAVMYALDNYENAKTLRPAEPIISVENIAEPNKQV
ncbi:MAG: PH domain-containing protein [Bacteroides sp.]|nr:PH domain-containing protein [Bacillota bacterium]MCM1455959.1 PH domain-containing protein [Bacteroides sp.]